MVAYILIEEFPYEGSTCRGVFSSPEQADVGKLKREKADKTGGYNTFFVEAFTVNAEVPH